MNSPTFPSTPSPFVLARLADTRVGHPPEWLTLARDPSLFQGWEPNHPSVRATGHSIQTSIPLLVSHAACLNVQGVATFLAENSHCDVNITPSLPISNWALNQVLITPLGAALTVQPCDDDGEALEWTAAQRASQEVIVGLLLAYGATATPLVWHNAVNALDLGSLHEKDTSPAVLERLLACGQDMPATLTDDGMTLLHAMADRADLWPAGLIEKVVARGVDVNAQSKEGDTALHQAITGSRPMESSDMVQRLIALGARWDVPNHLGQWPHHAAAFKNKTKVLDFLLNLGAPIEQPMHNDAVNGPGKFSALARSHLKSGTALHEAALNNACDAIDLLVKRGAHVDAKDADGNTPFMVAASLAHPNAVQALLHAGADETTWNDDGEDVWSLADRLNMATRPTDRTKTLIVLDRWVLERSVKETHQRLGTTDAPARKKRRL